MDAVKLIPQAFFEFFARLVPGFVALALWFILFEGQLLWKDALEAFTAGLLTSENVGTVAILLALAAAYSSGQLLAPFGKGMQRIAEQLAKIARRTLASLENKAEPAKAQASGAPQIVAKGNYDWLRALHPEVGALVAKIRAEATMFYSLAALFPIAWGAYLAVNWPNVPPALHLLPVLAIACGVRGYSTMDTFKSTSQKLRSAIEDADKWPPPSPRKVPS